jgi:alpha-mannosidase
MGGHFHDTGAGTATPASYEYAQNDDVIALNQFADVLGDATEAVAAGLNTQTQGTAVVVYNPLNIEREDVVEATVQFAGGAPKAVRVTGPDGREVPAQLEAGNKVVFLAKAPSVGYAVYDVQAADAPAGSELKVAQNTLENARYRVSLDGAGDVSSIFDKSIDKELLSAPIRLAISNDHPQQWPAWNMDFDQEQAPPRTFVRGGGRGGVRIVENGPARVALQVTRVSEGSHFVETVSLSAGDAGNRVEFNNSIDWATLYANLKATFPLSASNPMATYNLGIGTIQRPNAFDRQFEVGSHQWIDLTDQSGSYGATILTDVKNGSDKRDDHTIRLTLVRSPGVDANYTDQANQDWGHHEITFGIAGHKGDWRAGQTDWQGYRLNAPLIAFESAKHPGGLGKQFSLVKIDNPRIQIMAMKKAENSDEVILRLVEMSGQAQPNVRVAFAGPVTAAREVNGQELPVGEATIANGALMASFTANQPRTFAVRLNAGATRTAPVRSQPVTLAYDLSAATNDDTKSTSGFDGKGNALPAEMLPAELNFNGVAFKLGPAGANNAMTAKGQTVNLPAGRFNRVYILAASADGDQTAAFRTGGQTASLNVENWGGMIGQWDTRIWKNNIHTDKDWAVSANHAAWDPDPAKQRDSSQAKRDWSPRYPDDFAGITPGFIKRADVAWYASHHHTPEGLNQPYQYSYLFAYAIDLPADARTLTLPDNDKIRVMAISVAETNPAVKPAQPLYDTLVH